MMDSDLDTPGYSDYYGGGNDQPIPPGYPPGTTRDPRTGAYIFPPGYQGPGQTAGPTSNVGLPGVDGTPIPAPPPPGDTGGGGTNTGGATAPTGTLTGLLAPYQGTFTPPTPTAYPTAPTFTPPTYTPPPAFVPDQFSAPTFADAQNDPGYQFAADEGERSVAQSAASKGLLNTGGTLKDILAWGQNYAAQRYGDVYNRNYNTYQGNEGAKERAYATNYSSQFLDPYKFAYQGALDTFNPKQSQWQTDMAATQRGNENDYANAYNLFNFDYNKFKDQRDSTFNKTFQYVTA